MKESENTDRPNFVNSFKPEDPFTIKQNVEKKGFGVVAILDALGVKNLTLQESENFLSKRVKIVEEVEHTGYVLELMRELDGLKKERLISDGMPSTPVTFGDTIIFTWDNISKSRIVNTENEYLGKLFYTIASFLTAIMDTSLEEGIKFRGALSIGTYIRKKDTVIGPAIADAAAWYEQPDWIGIIATPKCGLYLDHLYAEETQGIYGFWKYPVPLGGRNRKKLWSIGWIKDYIPTAYSDLYVFQEFPRSKIEIASLVPKHKEEIINRAKTIFTNSLVGSDVPKGTESKYTNTLEFFDWCAEKYFPIFIQDFKFLKGISLFKEKEYKQALQILEKALNLSSKTPTEVLSCMAISYLRLNQYNKALKYANKAIAQNPKPFYIWGVKGTILTKLGRWEEAKKAYQEVLERKPKDVITLLNLLETYCALKNCEKTKEIINKITNQSEKQFYNFLARFYKIICFYLQNQKKKAEKEAETLTNLIKDSKNFGETWEFEPFISSLEDKIKDKELELIQSLKDLFIRKFEDT